MARSLAALERFIRFRLGFPNSEATNFRLRQMSDLALVQCEGFNSGHKLRTERTAGAQL